jgi:hypothetical protein
MFALQGWQDQARQYMACVREQVNSNNAISKCGRSHMLLLCSIVDAVNIVCHRILLGISYTLYANVGVAVLSLFVPHFAHAA